MKMIKSIFIISVIASSVLLACSEDSQKSLSKSNLHLKIVETTDMHGAIFPYDFINDTNVTYKGKPIPSMAQLSTYVKEERVKIENNNSKAFVLVDNGDLLQGQPIVNVFNNKDLTQTHHIYADVMNYLGYEVGVPGNHDVEPGHKVYDNLVNQFQFPWIAANLVKEGTNEPYFKGYSIVKRNGVKIAFLGLTTPGVPMWLPHEVWSGLQYLDMVDTAKIWVEKIKKEEKPDLLIGMFHSGWDYNYAGFDKNSTLNPNAVELILEKVPGFDLIFYGHDHIPKIYKENGVTALNAAAYMKSFAVADINLTWDKTEKKYQKSINAYQVNTNDYSVDQNFIQKFNDAFEETKTFVSQPVGTFTKSVNSRDAMFKDASFNDLIHFLEFYVAKEKLGEDIDMTIAAPLQYDVNIEAGKVKYADLWKLYKYDNTYYIMKMSGAEIKKYLEYDYDKWMNQMQDENDQLINFKKSATGEIERNEKGCAQTVTRYYNYDSIAGIVYSVDVSKPYGERITITGIDKNLDGIADADTTFDEAKEYKVGINSYRAGGGGGHMMAATGLTKDQLPDSRTIVKTETGLRDYLLSWIKDQGTLTPKTIGNWKIIPEDWASKGEAKSRAELYSGACAGH